MGNRPVSFIERIEDLKKVVHKLRSQRDAYKRQLDKTERQLQAELNRQKCECGRALVYYCAMCDYDERD